MVRLHSAKTDRLSSVLSGALALLVAFCGSPSLAQDASLDADGMTHAMAMHGTPLHGPDFEHFDYVNPDAPKRRGVALSACSARSTASIR
jgi:microcin C transport system substrate-binding protein